MPQSVPPMNVEGHKPQTGALPVEASAAGMQSLALGPEWYVLHLPETDSTMLRLREPDLSERGEEFVLLTAGYQTAGRGQRGTHWEAAAGQNLLFGIRLRPEAILPVRQFALSEAVALAVAESLSPLVAGVSVKWPNDIYVGDRKICGMLLEHELQGGRIRSTIIGVGLNVNQRTFTSDAPNPVSLRQLLRHDTDCGKLLAGIAGRFEQSYRALLHGDYGGLHARYLSRLYRRGQWAAYRDGDGAFEGRILDVQPSGMLRVERRGGGVRTYAFKEVTYILPAL